MSWQPVETAPNGVEVLTWQTTSRDFNIGCLDGGYWADLTGTVYGDNGFAKVTHWMPLPSPPSDKA